MRALCSYGAMYKTVIVKALEMVARITERIEDEQHNHRELKNTLHSLINLRNMLTDSEKLLMNRYLTICAMFLLIRVRFIRAHLVWTPLLRGTYTYF